MNSRIKHFISQLHKHQWDAFLITDSPSISYLTHFPSEEAWLFVSPKRSYYLTDARYMLEARRGLKGISVKVCRFSLIPAVFDLINQTRIKRIGFNPWHISLFSFHKLKAGCPKGVRFIADNDGIVEQMREIKTKQEIGNIQKAISLTQQAYNYLKHVIKPGVTEHHIFLKLEQYVRNQGYSFSFQPVITSGPNSCHPHAKITPRKILFNDIILVDMGIDVNGYKSDLTRMFFLGKIPALIKEIAKIVSDAQQVALDKIKPGVEASTIDKQVRNFLKKRKLSKYFGHSLGHGIGLEVHERPRIALNSKTILKPGMVFTIEPAVYIPNKFGIRLEDMVLVTQKGYQILSR